MRIYRSALFFFVTFVSISSIHSDDNRLSYNLIEGLPNVYLDPLSEAIGCTWEKGLVWDKPLIQKFYDLLAERSTFFTVIDVGAQTGSFSLLAKYFPNSSWYAFEPIEEAAQTLSANLALNDVHNVSVIQMAASHSTGSTTIHMPSMHSWGLSTLGMNVLRFTPVAERQIQCVDLDSYVQINDIQCVDFIKIDTEGWEIHVLEGAKHLIMKDRPILLLEHNDTNILQCNVSKKDVEQLLYDLNYEWFLISSEDILCIPR